MTKLNAALAILAASWYLVTTSELDNLSSISTSATSSATCCSTSSSESLSSATADAFLAINSDISIKFKEQSC